MKIIEGLLYALLMITLIKLVIFRYKQWKGKIARFNIKYFLRDNWMDYIINIGLSLVVYRFDHDAINSINYAFNKLGWDWEIIHVEDRVFYFVLVPVIVAALTYWIMRKKIALPVQNKLTPIK